MIQEAYCSFEVAKLLKEKGFDIICDKVYRKHDSYLCPFEYCMNLKGEGYYLAPTIQMAMRWLREVKHLHIVITIDGSQELKDKWLDERGIMIADCVCLYDFSIYNTKTGECRYSNSSMFDSLGYLTYGEAVDEAIKHCLENLI